MKALYRGAGNDGLTGGAGVDYFVFSADLGTGDVDKIADLSVLNGTIPMDDAVFSTPALALWRFPPS